MKLSLDILYQNYLRKYEYTFISETQLEPLAITMAKVVLQFIQLFWKENKYTNKMERPTVYS